MSPLGVFPFGAGPPAVVAPAVGGAGYYLRRRKWARLCALCLVLVVIL
jgi:hypothetical protein